MQTNVFPDSPCPPLSHPGFDRPSVCPTPSKEVALRAKPPPMEVPRGPNRFQVQPSLVRSPASHPCQGCSPETEDSAEVQVPIWQIADSGDSRK